MLFSRGLNLLYAELIVNEGFDGFNTGSRPSGWTFTNCNSDSDTYTAAGYYGDSIPSLKLDATSDQIETETFTHDSTNSLSFWLKGISTDATSSFLIEEYYTGSGWSTLTDIDNLPTIGTTEGPFSLQANQLRFTYTRSAGDLAFDDVRINNSLYMRAYFLCWTDYGSTGNYGDAVYYEIPGQ